MEELYAMKVNIKKEHKKGGCGWIDCFKIFGFQRRRDCQFFKSFSAFHGFNLFD
jgi:hypothetical protein